METIDHLGQTYVKATALAKKYRYTTDYIGQLCRQGKVTAKLVGRAWFVVEDSLVQHKSDRYSALRSPEIINKDNSFSEKATHKVLIKREVYPRISKTTFRQLAGANFENKINVKGSVFSYNEDSSNLDPSLKSKKAVIPVEEKQQKLKIHLVSNAKTNLAFENIPEVSLSGNLEIMSDETELDNYVVEALSVEDISSFEPENAATTVTMTKRYERTDFVNAPLKNQQPVEGLKKPLPKNDFIPASIKSIEKKETTVTFTSVKSFLITTCLFCLVSASSLMLIFGLSFHLETDGSNLKQSLKFSSAAAIDSIQTISISY